MPSVPKRSDAASHATGHRPPPLLLLSSLLLPTLLGACAPVLDHTEMRTLDGVKLIKASVSDPQAPETIQQDKYVLDDSSRILLRYETLSKNSAEIRTEDGHKVRLLVAPVQAETSTPSPPAAADATLLASAASLKACPLKRNWMMAATWRRAHPFSPQGRWSREGGDYDPIECVSATSVESGFASFDVTPWFLNYVRGRSQNYGLILIHESATPGSTTSIRGDASGSYSPRLQWEKSALSPFTPPSSHSGSAQAGGP